MRQGSCSPRRRRKPEAPGGRENPCGERMGEKEMGEQLTCESSGESEEGAGRRRGQGWNAPAEWRGPEAKRREDRKGR